MTRKQGAFRKICLLVLICILPACTTTRTLETTNTFIPSEASARVLLIEPDVQLSFLKASGIVEVRADWTRAGKENVLSEIEKSLAGNGHLLISHDLDVNNDREVQFVKLHQVVGETILIHRYLGVPLPTKEDQFDWSLGPGVSDIAGDTEADYALFLFARGQYASSARQAMAIGLAVAGVGTVSNGGQAAYASLVDMRTGDIVWFNVASTGAGTDMREQEGAETLVRAILKNIPLRADEEGDES